MKRELRELRDEVKELRGAMEPEPPEPEYECSGGECEGFALEEVGAEEVTTKSSLLGNSTRPERVGCPRCGEEMSVEEFVPKEEQQTRGGTKPLVSNRSSAERGLEQRFEEEGRKNVLRRAGGS